MPSISFFHPKQADVVLPAAIKRTFVQTPSGPLELLIADPADPSLPRKQPLYFAHGGCGGAAVWLEWMEYLSQQHNIPCYAVSYRGHGSSWYPSYFRMYFTTKRTLASDLVAGLRRTMEIEKEKTGKDVKVVLVGHSSGGGLSQLTLSEYNIKVNGLALVAAIPGFGSMQVNQNWTTMDPWFTIRMFFLHLGHPMSPLSSSRLVKQAFFCASYPMSLVKKFEERMPRMESMLWPMGMLFKFVAPANILRNICGWGSSNRIAIIGAENDKLVDIGTAKKTADFYREATIKAASEGSLKVEEQQIDIEPSGKSKGYGVRYYEIKEAGHHCMNDLQWQDGADKLLDWYNQL